MAAKKTTKTAKTTKAKAPKAAKTAEPTVDAEKGSTVNPRFSSF